MSLAALLHSLGQAIDAGDHATAKQYLGVLTKDIKGLEFRSQRAQRDKAIVSSLLSKVSTDLETSLQVQKRFIASVSHEMRTPLNAIMGFMKLLSDTPLTDQQRGWLSHSTQSSQQLLRLINDVLDVSKAEAGQLELRQEAVALDDLLNETIAQVMPRLEGKAVVVHKAIPVLAHYVMADPVRVKQIVLNLLVNAVKFTEQGQISVGLSLSPIDSATVSAQISIVDTGIGIPSHKLGTLFEPFVQAHSRANHEGTGLGLYLSQALAKLMGGHISLTSEEGKGTHCLVTLPLGQGGEKKDQSSMRESSSTTAELEAQRALSVLVVDDVELNRFLLKQILIRYFGVTPLLANDGVQAVQMATENAFDLILMDIQMPNMNGLEATREILLRQPDQVIYAVSANAFSEDIEAALSAGMKGFLTKPIQIPLLTDIIVQCTQHHLAKE